MTQPPSPEASAGQALRGFAASVGKNCLVLCWLLAPSFASAQTFEVSAAAVWTGGYDAGSQDALLTRNPSTGTAPLTWFQTTSRVPASVGAEARAGIRVMPRLALEAIGRFNRPELQTTILSDFESATGDLATLPVTSYLIGGSALFDLRQGKLTPFVSGGAAHLRQMQEGEEIVSATEWHAGGGVKYALSRHLALRADTGISVRSKSVAFDATRRVLPVLSAGLAYRF